MTIKIMFGVLQRYVIVMVKHCRISLLSDYSNAFKGTESCSTDI
jgi:hypothetical protein